MNCGENKYCRCLFYSANALARNITKLAEDSFSITGLAPSQAFLIMTVNSSPGINPMEISRIMMLSPSTVTRLLEKLESKKYIERKSEGRKTMVFPLKKSIKLDIVIKEAWGELYRSYSAALGSEFAENLTNEIYNSALKLENL
ncbi:MAG: hypothetical protein QG635_580 [Bacteroidota bacterium]|nr:hypothetical protein [Bacteroidota bacterium]